MPDTKSINLKVNDGLFLEQLMSKQSVVSIDGQDLKPEQVNRSTNPNFISIMVSGDELSKQTKFHSKRQGHSCEGTERKVLRKRVKQHSIYIIKLF
jgi:hypothetical protein